MGGRQVLSKTHLLSRVVSRLSPLLNSKEEEMRKKVFQKLKEAQEKGEIVGVTFTFYGRPGYVCSGKLLVLTETFLQLEGGHPIYFDYPSVSIIEEIRVGGVVIYKRKPA